MSISIAEVKLGAKAPVIENITRVERAAGRLVRLLRTSPFSINLRTQKCTKYKQEIEGNVFFGGDAEAMITPMLSNAIKIPFSLRNIFAKGKVHNTPTFLANSHGSITANTHAQADTH